MESALLLNNDILDQQSENGDIDDYGCSSGYDSASELTDSEASEDKLSLLNDVNKTENSSKDDISATNTKMTFKSTNNLCDHLKYILSMPELCDVTFLVGPSKVPVYGVKAILGTRSKAMYQLILRQQKEDEVARKTKKRCVTARITIDVHKYEPEDFRKLVQFIHCGYVDINTSNVTGLLCGASQFGLVDLKTACWDYINICRKVKDNSIEEMYRFAKKYSHFRVAAKLVSKICAFLDVKSTMTAEVKNISQDVRHSNSKIVTIV